MRYKRYTRYAPLSRSKTFTKIMNKTIYRVIMGMIAIAFFSMLTYIVLLLTEKSPIYYTNLPFPVLGNQRVYKPWDKIYFHVDRCIRKDLRYSFTSNIVNVATWAENPMESASITATVWCSSIVSVPTTIPELPTWHYRKTFIITAKGKYRNFVNDLTTEPFFVSNDLTAEELFHN